MKRNLLWLIGILALVAGAALLRPQPPQPSSPTPSPVLTATPDPEPAVLTYFEKTLKNERYNFKVLGRPGAWSFACLMEVEKKKIEDSGSLSQAEFQQIQAALQKASSAEKGWDPVDVSPPIQRKKKPGKIVEFSLAEQNHTLVGQPEPDSQTRRVLDRELQPTLVFHKRDLLRKEMHARFNL